jgi:hypothetical protein
MNLSQSEWAVGLIGAAIVAGYFLWRVWRRWVRLPATPDPWGQEIAEALESPDATPVCPHCQCPEMANRWFCPECGHAVGDYNNVSPYLYLFSLGEVLRAGTSGRFRKSWLTVTGFIILSLTEYVVFAPIYWFFLFRNLAHMNDRRRTESAPPVLTR